MPRFRHLVLGLAALLAASCSDTPAPQPGQAAPASDAPAPPEGVFRLQGCEPQSLLPAAVVAPCGEQVVAALFDQLVELDRVTGQPRWGRSDDAAIADEITSRDGRTWRIELEEGWEFHDGEPVTAQSFVDAWNHAVVGAATQPSAFLFDVIDGFEEVHCPEPGCEPADDTLDGLGAVGEQTLEVTLDRPMRDFPRLLGHLAFSPLPAAALEDPDTWQEAPVGNGPFRVEGVWEHEQVIRLRAVQDHAGVSAASAGVDVLLDRPREEVVADLRDGTLDLAAQAPPAAAEADEAGLTTVQRPGDDYVFLVVPSHLPALADRRLGLALSLAIDRQAVIDDHVDAGARPARGLVPAVAGGTNACGDRCRFDPQAARELLDQVGLPEAGIALWFDRDTPQGGWVNAIAEQLRNNLGLSPEQVRVRSLPHSQFLAHAQDHRITGLYPLGWSMDVPSAGEYLRQAHGPDGLVNLDGYRSTSATELLDAADRATSPEEQREWWTAAEEAILEDWHHVPLWVLDHRAVHGARVTDVHLDGHGRVDLAAVEVRAPE